MSKIACFNCGPCDDPGCICTKCVAVLRKRDKVNRRQARALSRKGKNYSEDEI